MCVSKGTVRRNCLQSRRLLTDREKAALDRAIADKLLQSKMYLAARTILCYVSLPQEIDTQRIIADAVLRGKRVAVPRCGADRQMEFFYVTSEDDLAPGTFGIPAPKETCALCVPQQNDLCIVPCLAADRRGYRLGYGGGYYDRYLARRRMQTIGLCYSAYVKDTLPTDSFDVSLQTIVTDKEVYIWQNGRLKTETTGT